MRHALIALAPILAPVLAPVLALAAALAAPAAAQVSTPSIAVPARTTTHAWTLTPSGYGPVRIGMTREQVGRALGEALTPRADHEEDACESGRAPSLPGMIFMFEDLKLTRISLYEESPVRTPRGVGIGYAESEVRRLYPGVVAEEHAYVGLPGLYLTYWLVPGKKGVRFETNETRRVTAIHAGAGSITYIEGCL